MCGGTALAISKQCLLEVRGLLNNVAGWLDQSEVCGSRPGPYL